MLLNASTSKSNHHHLQKVLGFVDLIIDGQEGLFPALKIEICPRRGRRRIIISEVEVQAWVHVEIAVRADELYVCWYGRG